jgi:dTMP kinase
VSKGRFIVFEGGEGTGKTTQIKRLEARLKEAGRDVVLSWEPGGTPLGEKVRSVILDPNSGPMSARCEALLYAACRAEHVDKVIRPALDRGAIVLCDRYWDASRAYQGVARRLGILAIDRINWWATEGLFPDRVYLFDIDPSIGLERAKSRTGQADRLEQEGKPFHNEVRKAYLHIAHSDPSRYEIINAAASRDEISEQLWQSLSKCLR